VALFLPARAHDALNRLLRVVPLSTRALMGLLIALSKRRYAEGYLCLDDCVIEKAFAKKLCWAGWTYSFAKKRKLYGLHVVVLLWCASEEGFRIPVAFRLWRPKRWCARRAYKTQLELSEEMLKEVVGSGLRACYIVFDTHYSAGWFTRMVTRLGLVWVGTLHPRTIVVWGAKQRSVGKLARILPLKWRKHLGVRAVALNVYAPKNGSLRLVVTRNLPRQPRVHRHQRLGSRPHHGGFAQGEPLVRRDALSRHQAVCGIGGVPMPGGSSDGLPRRSRFAHLRRIADDGPESGRERGRRQGTLAVEDRTKWRISSSTPQCLSTPSSSHRVNPVIYLSGEFWAVRITLSRNARETVVL
jgi:hypothetical protein